MKKPVLALTLCALISTGSVLLPSRQEIISTGWGRLIKPPMSSIRTKAFSLLKRAMPLPKASTRSSGMEIYPVRPVLTM